MAAGDSPANGLWKDNGNAAHNPGPKPVMKNADGSAINSGGVGGTLATPTPTTVVKPSSFIDPQPPKQPSSGKPF